MPKTFKAVMIVLAASFFVGCAHLPGGIAPSTTPIEGRNYDILGDVVGTDSKVMLLGILPLSGPNTIQDAIDDAKNEKGADALIDVTAEAYGTYWILWGTNTTVVRGKAIKFKK